MLSKIGSLINYIGFSNTIEAEHLRVHYFNFQHVINELTPKAIFHNKNLIRLITNPTCQKQTPEGILEVIKPEHQSGIIKEFVTDLVDVTNKHVFSCNPNSVVNFDIKLWMQQIDLNKGIKFNEVPNLDLFVKKTSVMYTKLDLSMLQSVLNYCEVSELVTFLIYQPKIVYIIGVMGIAPLLFQLYEPGAFKKYISKVIQQVTPKYNLFNSPVVKKTVLASCVGSVFIGGIRYQYLMLNKPIKIDSVISSGVNGLSRSETVSAIENVIVGVKSGSSLINCGVHNLYKFFSSISSAAFSGIIAPKMEAIKDIVDNLKKK